MVDDGLLPAPDAGPVAIEALTVWLLDGPAVIWLYPTGELQEALAERAADSAPKGPGLCCHRLSLLERVGAVPSPAYDLLELFAFVHPGRFCVPSPAGLAEALGLDPPPDIAHAATTLQDAAATLLATLARGETDLRSDPAGLAEAMDRGGWPWAPLVLRALAAGGLTPRERSPLAIWRRLGEWEDEAPDPPAPQRAPDPLAVRSRLADLITRGDGPVEERADQQAYAQAVSAAFQVADDRDLGPTLVLAQAGTGIGKTLGYLAPASLWAENNDEPVWISTFTRNLQGQVDQDLHRVYPNPAERLQHTVIRKGRENYLCLAKYQEATSLAQTNPAFLTALGLMARWMAVSRDGDLQGPDFPAWLPDLVGRRLSVNLADRRGDCTFSACDHYRRCYVEHTIRRAKRAKLVIANHALVLSRAALDALDANDESLNDPEEGGVRRLRYIFDEGHQLFEAADSVFASHLSGLETRELRRWMLGTERRGLTGSDTKGGLARRLENLLGHDPQAEDEGLTALDQILAAAHALPGEGWLERVEDDRPVGVTEHFLAAVFAHVAARAGESASSYGQEADIRPLGSRVTATRKPLITALDELAVPVRQLASLLAQVVQARGEGLTPDQRRRLQATRRSLTRRAMAPLVAWRAMLEDLAQESPPALCDWFAVERSQGRLVDVGYYRHWRDPMQPLMATLRHCAQGLVVTSATLADGPLPSALPANDAGSSLLVHTGLRHQRGPAHLSDHPSPFDYGALAKVIIVTDVDRNDAAAVAGATRALFEAAGGGALGIFTAIHRLRDIHRRIAPPLREAGIRLWAQHVDGMDVATLISLFRHDPDSCLLGTDAVRDGVNVPGRALRLILMDRVPWPRPSILHRARREVLGGRAWDEHLVALRLKQAFGRLIRRADDRGAFVMLEARWPSRLLRALPPAVEVSRVPLDEACQRVHVQCHAAQAADC